MSLLFSPGSWVWRPPVTQVLSLSEQSVLQENPPVLFPSPAQGCYSSRERNEAHNGKVIYLKSPLVAGSATPVSDVLFIYVFWGLFISLITLYKLQVFVSCCLCSHLNTGCMRIRILSSSSLCFLCLAYSVFFINANWTNKSYQFEWNKR